MAETGQRVGGQILVAAAATSAGFLAFVPTEFRGVAELGLIAGVGMLIAFLCTLTFLPAAISSVPPARRNCAEIGFRWAAPLDEVARRRRRPLLALFAALAALGVGLLPQLRFDSNPLHTKNPNTEAMRTLHDLMGSPVTNPFTIDILAANPAAAATLSQRLRKLPLVAGVLSIDSFVPKHQKAKLAQIQDAAMLLGPTLAPLKPLAPPSRGGDPRRGPGRVTTALAPALAKPSPDPLLVAIAGDLRRLAAAPDPRRARRQCGADPVSAGAARPAAQRALGPAGLFAQHPAGAGARLGSARRTRARAGACPRPRRTTAAASRNSSPK